MIALLMLASIGMMVTAEYHDKIDTSEMVISSALEELQGEWSPEKMLANGNEVKDVISPYTLVIEDGRGVVVYSPESKEMVDEAKALSGVSWTTPYRPIGVTESGVLMRVTHYEGCGRKARIKGHYIALFAINDDGMLVEASNIPDQNLATSVVFSLEPSEGKVVVYYGK